MNAREFLTRPETLRRQIEQKRYRIETLRRLARRVTAHLSDVRVQSTPDPSRTQGFLAEAADEEQEILRLEERRNQALVDSALLISRLPDEKMARILELRYLDRLGWEEITEEMGCCASRVYRLHQLALEILTPPPEAPEETENLRCNL